ncbi:hypothetical protein EJP617_17440 [Erwinia sp. Ejp617]|nr:trypsin-like peptidase domain-containing protein [Erwinia sp. Ejp617]ADP11425.1 hypothetical protein EJP617_17440 [Erwinia sp. Ejp617]
MSFNKSVLNILLFSGLCSSFVCAGDIKKTNQLSTVKNEIQRLACYKEKNLKIYNHGLSTALVSGKGTGGSGTLLGTDNLFLTNNASITDSVGEKVAGEIFLNYHHLDCNEQSKEIGIGISIELDRVLASGDGGLDDYALLSIDPFDFKYANVKRLFGGVEVSKNNPDIGEALYIPQYGNGAKIPVHVSDKKDGAPCKLINSSGVLDYNCQAALGSTGAPVISQASHKLVGVNYGGSISINDVSHAVSAEKIMNALSAFITDENNREQLPLQHNIVPRQAIINPNSYQGELLNAEQPVWFTSSDPELKIEHMQAFSLATFMKKDEATGVVEEDKTRKMKIWLQNECGEYSIDQKPVCEIPGKTRLMYSVDMSQQSDATPSTKRYWLILTQHNEQGMKEEEMINFLESTGQ